MESGTAWAEGQLDRSSPVPLYYQLQELLKRELEGERWSPGDLLPSEAEFSVMLGISRTVIRKALDVLEGDGQIYRAKGKGTIVAPLKFRHEAIDTARDWYLHKGTTIPTVSKVVHAAELRVSGHLSRVLQLPAGAPAWELVTISEVASEPVSLSQMYLRNDASEKLKRVRQPAEIVEEGGQEVLQQLARVWGVQFSGTELDVQHAIANSFEAEELRIPLGAPVLLQSLLSLDRAQRPVSFARTVVRSDRFHLSLWIPSRAVSNGP
jgi:GntR family transcriptional regulator